MASINKTLLQYLNELDQTGHVDLPEKIEAALIRRGLVEIIWDVEDCWMHITDEGYRMMEVANA